jgi:multidrug efflux system membrane fusion protein
VLELTVSAPHPKLFVAFCTFKNNNMKFTVLLFICLSVLFGCGKGSVPAANIEAAKSEQPVLTQVVEAVASDSGNVYSGEIRARHETQLGFRIGGKIIERLVDAGAKVKAGQVLARLDPADSSLQASSAQAQYQLAMEDVKRYRELRNKNFVSQSALDAKEAALKSIAAQAGLAGNQTAYTSLRADHAGVISATLAEAGQVVMAGQPVFRLAQEGEREVAIAIPETQFASLKIGAPADVTLWSSGSESAHHNGHLRELTPVADSASRTYAARVALDSMDARVALGMTAQVRFKSSGKRDKMIVPLSAIFQQGDQAAVWVVAADRSISLRKVEVAAYRDSGAVIASGVVAGERIVSAGVHKLSAGEKIRIIEGEATNGNTR